MQIIIASDGSCRCLYTEQIDLTAIGQICIQRASYVEPDEQGRWWADLSILHGPALGPYPSRSGALAAEERWLNDHWLSC